jgi:hypothetical protein
MVSTKPGTPSPTFPLSGAEGFAFPQAGLKNQINMSPAAGKPEAFRPAGRHSRSKGEVFTQTPKPCPDAPVLCHLIHERNTRDGVPSAFPPKKA